MFQKNVKTELSVVLSFSFFKNLLKDEFNLPLYTFRTTPSHINFIFWTIYSFTCQLKVYTFINLELKFENKRLTGTPTFTKTVTHND